MSLIDEIDRQIIKLLQINPRMSYSEIAREIGFSRNAIKYRIKVLQNEGLLLGFRTVLNPRKFGKKITAIISLKTDLPDINIVKRGLLEMPELLMVFHVSGNYPFVTIGLFDDHDELEKFLSTSLSSIPISEFDVKIIIDELKDSDFNI
ncbi:MAG: Lrp/AsnC family transcriptional regulator [Candidatus Thermoplasmatota archaeon]|nr:Lrp/AsnC family transcriptional regulator [Candidatus Thermoplasmatota archaeon]